MKVGAIRVSPPDLTKSWTWGRGGFRATKKPPAYATEYAVTGEMGTLLAKRGGNDGPM